ncbi:hypothetical protein FWH13_00895, partial [Candidatus Saccharibacteria bacterium]|nr:hypothetical protein [Candidatus Saccharibacteria bacterium]
MRFGRLLSGLAAVVLTAVLVVSWSGAADVAARGAVSERLAVQQTPVTSDPPVSTEPPFDVPEDAETAQLRENQQCDLGRFGWAICGLVNTANNLLGSIYENVIEQMLVVPAGFMCIGGPECGTYEAWTVFRDIANVIFVLMFLLVIFSQITSVGISNYGIKKIFPKLLITAILINLSFFIAQAAVDLSNILGSQLNSLLSSIMPPPPATGGSTAGPGFLGIILPILGIGLAGFAFLTLAGGIGGVMAVFIMLIISGLIAVALIFAVLVFRQVAVVLLVVMAPLAFAAMLLPNTEKLYRSWFNAFKAMLMVYPVAGALMGGGVLAGRVIATSVAGLPADDPRRTLFALIAAAATILPFFLVITVTKTALLGLGMVGGALTGKMNQLGGAVGGAAKKP